MTIRPAVPSDPDLRGVPDALLRAAEKARMATRRTEELHFHYKQPLSIPTGDGMGRKRHFNPKEADISEQQVTDRADRNLRLLWRREPGGMARLFHAARGF